MAGYANRLISLTFDDLTDDPKSDPVWVSIRNPKLMPPGELQARSVPTNEDGTPLDSDAALSSMYEVVAKLVVAWRVYDATVLEVDPDTREPLDQPLLGLPATPELIAKLPLEIINRISEQMSAAVNPA
ncbi:MAG: hypothetical protein JWO67_3192 [Streptosporangiaceae bacterium]|nr:hypothetical protein [Streptosporangiaceae bacterium]